MKKNSSLQEKPAGSPGDLPSWDRAFLIKGTELSPMESLPEKPKPVQKPLKEEEHLKLIMKNRALLFGEQTLGISANVIKPSVLWDAFLFDFTEPGKPRCYLLTTSVGSVAFEQFFFLLTWIFGFLKSIDKRRMLVDSLITHVLPDKQLVKAIQAHTGKEKSIEDFFSEVILTRCRVLLLTDAIRPELPSLWDAYHETWSAMLTILYTRKFQAGKANVLTVFPMLDDFRRLNEDKPKAEKAIHTEDHHFSKGSPVVRTIYEKLKAEALKLDKTVVFNAKGKHYISLKKGAGKNLAFFHFRKHTMYMVVMLEEKVIRKMVKKSEIKTLPPSVQSFWNGASTGIVISGTDHLKEITEVFKKLTKQ